LYIDISGQKLQSAELYNMQGKRINVFNQSLLPVEELSAGVYYLVINTSGGSVVKKFIKQ
jgi:hypothetical protein